MRFFLLILLTFFLHLNVKAKCKKNLQLFNQGITDASTIEIPKCTRRLILDGNPLESLEGLELPPKLKELTLNSTLLDDFSPLLGFENLMSLNIALNELNEQSVFSGIPKTLKELGLGGNLFQTIDLTEFTELKSLNTKGMFDITRGATDFLLDFSQVLLPESLETLLLTGSDFGAIDYSDLVLPEGLKKLDLATGSIEETDLATINFPPNLRNLKLKRNNITTLDGIEFPESLRVLNLQLNPIADDKEELQKLRQRLGRKVRIITKCNRRCSNRP